MRASAIYCTPSSLLVLVTSTRDLPRSSLSRLCTLSPSARARVTATRRFNSRGSYHARFPRVYNVTPARKHTATVELSGALYGHVARARARHVFLRRIKWVTPGVKNSLNPYALFFRDLFLSPSLCALGKHCYLLRELASPVRFCRRNKLIPGRREHGPSRSEKRTDKRAEKENGKWKTSDPGGRGRE